MKIGPYEVLGELGRGGMGAVYRVRRPDGGDAALKLLLRTDGFARFERERRLLASLGEKEGFVGLLDAGISPEGAWLVMPFVPGGTLRKKLEAGPLGVEETVALGTGLATALGHAHERGIVHRDVKPENVLFTAAGRPLLADLGLAKHFDRLAGGGSQSVSLSQDGVFKGTAGYMAPEQLEDAARAGPPADAFAVGAVLYECLAGRPAFPGHDVVEVLAKLSSGTVEPIGRPHVPAWLEAIVRRALAPDPRARFADGLGLARALADRGKAPRGSRRAVLPLVLGGVVGAVVLAAALGLRESAPAPPARPSARELVERAIEKAERNDLDGANADATRAIELDPGLATAWRIRGTARGKKGDLDGQIADATRALEIDPKLARAWASRGGARGLKGDPDGEIADMTKAIELDPRYVVAWEARGWARGRKGDWDGTIADLTEAIELDPGRASAMADRGLARAKKGDLDGEIADETRAIELDPALAAAWEARGLARGKKGDRDGAIADLTKAIELDPRAAEAWASRGLARGQAGDWDAAIADLEHALEVDPAGPNAAHFRSLLESARKARAR